MGQEYEEVRVVGVMEQDTLRAGQAGGQRDGTGQDGFLVPSGNPGFRMLLSPVVDVFSSALLLIPLPSVSLTDINLALLPLPNSG